MSEKIGVQVGKFRFVFSDDGLQVAYTEYYGAREIYRSPWKQVMLMPTSYLPSGFHEAYSEAVRVVSTKGGQ